MKTKGIPERGVPRERGRLGAPLFFSHPFAAPKALKACLVFGDRTGYLFLSALPRQWKPTNFRIRG